MDRWLAPVLVGVVALALGFGIGALVYGNDDPDVATDPDAVTTQPTAPAVDPASQQTCLAALESVERDLQAEERLAGLLNDYESVINRATDALAEFDTRRLEQLLTEIEALNRQSQRLIDETRTADTSEALDTCRSVIGTPGS